MSNRPFRLITSQGRIGDRTPHAIAGARACSDMLADRLSIEAHIVGSESGHQVDDWSVSLPAANETLSGLAREVTRAIEAGDIPLLSVNTCSAGIATLPAAARSIPGIKVLWIDAHGDFNTPETTGSGYLGGMALAGACGLWRTGHGSEVVASDVAIIGIRDIDSAEQTLLEGAGVTLMPGPIDLEALLSFIGNASVWIHIDWDVLEPNHVPAAYQIADGLLPDQLRAVLEAISAEQIAGIELAEFEAPEDAAEREKALAVIGDIVEPLIASR
ncbi:arginase family protein [Rhizobium sp. 2MFCol3.1]|uniref:arginase family protein n=1 Tax=Rhizobium sp. 2MFCol3.1 TaxID=1246459 RepID=UPI00037E4211|nr:arginase family protein [Rhizobium sp. 2MFCol3.1]